MWLRKAIYKKKIPLASELLALIKIIMIKALRSGDIGYSNGLGSMVWLKPAVNVLLPVITGHRHSADCSFACPASLVPQGMSYSTAGARVGIDIQRSNVKKKCYFLSYQLHFSIGMCLNVCQLAPFLASLQQARAQQ